MKLSDFPNCISKYDIVITPTKIQVYRKNEEVLHLDSSSPFYENFRNGFDQLTEAGGNRDTFIETFIDILGAVI